MRLSPTEKRVFNLIPQMGIPGRSLSSLVGINLRRSYKYLHKLREKNFVFALRTKRTYELTAQGREILRIIDEIEKLRIDFSKIITPDDFDDFKKTINNKLAIIDGSLASLEELKAESRKLSELIETTVAIERKNREDIADIAMTVGNAHIKRVSDYENQIAAMLNILDTLAGQVSAIKRKLGMGEKRKIKVSKISPKLNKSVSAGKELKMENIEVHPDISKKIFSESSPVPEAMLKVSKKNLDEEENQIKNIKNEIKNKKQEKQTKNLQTKNLDKNLDNQSNVLKEFHKLRHINPNKPKPKPKSKLNKLKSKNPKTK
jgi:predicted transcriptional regulator/ribosomal protein L31E